jgi:hypothetical protein
MEVMETLSFGETVTFRKSIQTHSTMASGQVALS